MPQVQIRDKQGNGIPLLNIRLGANGEDVDSAYDDKFTDYAGNTSWPNPVPSPIGYTLFINQRNVNNKYISRTEPIPNLDKDYLYVMDEVIVPLQGLHIDGDKFRTEDNNEWKMCFGSNFMLPQLVAEGVDISPLLYNGLNGYRIFGSYAYIADQVGMKRWHPDNYPNWLNAIGDTFDILAGKNKYGSLNIYCDNQVFGKDVPYLTQKLNDIAQMGASKKNALFSLANENEANGINADNFTKPNGIIIACGSGLTGGPAPLSRGKPWDLQYQHLRRDEKMFIDIPPVDAPSYWLEHKLLFDETIGYADFNDPGKRTNNSDWAYKMGRIMSAFNGGVIHLNSGGHSQPLVGKEVDCVAEFVRSFNA